VDGGAVFPLLIVRFHFTAWEQKYCFSCNIPYNYS
jgi:hypothetical protein